MFKVQVSKLVGVVWRPVVKHHNLFINTQALVIKFFEYSFYTLTPK